MIQAPGDGFNNQFDIARLAALLTRAGRAQTSVGFNSAGASAQPLCREAPHVFDKITRHAGQVPAEISRISPTPTLCRVNY